MAGSNVSSIAERRAKRLANWRLEAAVLTVQRDMVDYQLDYEELSADEALDLIRIQGALTAKIDRRLKASTR